MNEVIDEPHKRSAPPVSGILIRGAHIMSTRAVMIGALLEDPGRNRAELQRAYEGLIRDAAQSAMAQDMAIQGLLLELTIKSIAKSAQREAEIVSS
jgi:hypothetical protein